MFKCAIDDKYKQEAIDHAVRLSLPSKTIIDGEEKYINIPKIKQFRVYFESKLKRRGFNDFARANLLGHDDKKMLDYYGRDVATIKFKRTH